MPLLHYFSNADLQNLDTTEDDVYFNAPFYFVSYPFSWILKMAIGALVLFLVLLLIGLGKRVLIGREIAKGFLILLITLAIGGLCTYFGWQLLLKIYTEYEDILQGFTYNGHYYIAAFVFSNFHTTESQWLNSKTQKQRYNNDRYR